MKTLQGIVTSLKNAKTATVTTERKWRHPTFGKSVRRTKKYACHVDGIDLVVGDIVTIAECVPVSKTKRFIVTEKIEKK